jgi:hypothetical protein
MVLFTENEYYWTPNNMSDVEVKLILSLLRGQENKNLHDKIWCWNMNYRNKKKL